MGTSDGAGGFRIQRDPYAPPADCTVDINDGSTATVVRLSGCTVSSTPADVTAPTAPSSLTASLVGATATLSWAPSTDNVGVIGYRDTRNATVLLGTVTGTTFSDGGLGRGTYTYTVRASAPGMGLSRHLRGGGRVGAQSQQAGADGHASPRSPRVSRRLLPTLRRAAHGSRAARPLRRFL